MTPADTLTLKQFDALAALAGLRSPTTAAVARLVLVDGLAPSIAADSAGISRQQLSNTLARLREALVLARRVCG